MTPLLQVEGVRKSYGGLLAVADATFAIERGTITGLIGPNGAGKTTLFAIIAGFVKPSAGRVLFEGADVTAEPPHRRARRGIVRTFQIVQPFAGLSVRENIAVGAHLRHAGRKQALDTATEIAGRVGLSTELDKPASALTVAGRKRLELARALATRPTLLLLDEVLAGLNPSEVAAMLPVLRGLAQDGITVLMIEHVMQAVMQLCGHIHVLAQVGSTGGHIIAAGLPAAICADPAVIEAYFGVGAARRMAVHG